MLQTRQSLKTRLGLYLSLTLSKKKFHIFFSKNQIRKYARSACERTASCVNICPRKVGCQKSNGPPDTLYLYGSLAKFRLRLGWGGMDKSECVSIAKPDVCLRFFLSVTLFRVGRLTRSSSLSGGGTAAQCDIHYARACSINMTERDSKEGGPGERASAAAAVLYRGAQWDYTRNCPVPALPSLFSLWMR